MRPKTYCFLLHLFFRLHDEVKNGESSATQLKLYLSLTFAAILWFWCREDAENPSHLSTLAPPKTVYYPQNDAKCVSSGQRVFTYRFTVFSYLSRPITSDSRLRLTHNRKPPSKKNSSEMSITLHYGKLTFCSSCGHEIALWPLFDRAETDITSPAKMHLNFSADLCWDETSRKPGLLIRLSRGGFQNGGEKHVNTVQEHAQTQKPRQC